MQVSDIKHDVRVILGENENVVPFLSLEEAEAPGSLATERDILTEAMILTAVNNVHGVAPLEMLTDILKTTTVHTDIDKFGGYSRVDLPDNFMRMVMLEDESWSIPVTELTDIAGEGYMQLKSRFEGIRANVERPAAAFKTIEGKNVIEAFPTLTSSKLYYVERQDKIVNGEVSVAMACYRAVVYLIASLYYVSIKETDMARVMESQSKSLLGIGTGE